MNSNTIPYISTSDTIADNRITFLDNLRWLLVLFVILEHSSNAYTNLVWWPVADRDTSVIAGWISAFSDAFAMPLLFYIAGYFTIPSIEKKGVLSFLKGKLRRLGIPWLICILTICPILPLIYHFTRNGLSLSMSYGALWVELFRNAANFNFGLIVSMNELMVSNQFYQRYMWFLSLLFLFFLVFSLIYSFNKSWFYRDDQPISVESPSISSTLKFFLGIGFLTAVCSFLTVGAILTFGPKSSNPEPLLTLGNIIQFRPSRLFFFLIYFGLGILTFRNKWIERGKLSGDLKTWAILLTSLLIVFLFVCNQIQNGPDDLKEMYGAIYFFILNFLTIATLGILTSIGIRYWNRPNTFNRKMASNSYDMYLSHYFFVLIFQLILYTLPGVPGLLKFGIVSILSIVCAYAISQFFIKVYPRISIFVIFIMLIAMVILIRP